MATREEHRELARELLLAYAHGQDRDATGRLGNYLEPRQLEALFAHQDEQTLPRMPTSYLILPKLTRGGTWWPKLGLWVAPDTKPAGRPPLELLSLEVILVPDPAGDGNTAAVEPRVRCVAFRFEPPSCFANNVAPEGDHDYYHMQFVSMPRAGRGASADNCFQLPDRFPAFPLRARDFGSLVLGLAVALYGRNFAEGRGRRGVDLDLSTRTRQKLKEAYKDLGYWTWG